MAKLTKKIGLLTVLIVTALIGIAAITVTMGDVRIKVTPNYTTFYVYEGGWRATGTEYNFLYNGTKKLAPQSTVISADLNNLTNMTTITREVTFTGKKLIDTYVFNGSVSDKSRFPIQHSIEVYNASGLTYQYEVRRLYYTGLSRNATSPESFGYNMKVEWGDGAYFAKIYNSSTGRGSLRLKYLIPSDYEAYNIRLFDPTAPVVTLNSPANNSAINNTNNFNFTATDDASATMSCTLYVGRAV